MTEFSAHQSLLDQLHACENQDERERLLMYFSLSQLSVPLRVAVQAAAVPRFFDRNFLNALLEQPLDESQFAELTDLSYIEPYPGEGRFNVHERSRKLLQEKLWQEDEALYRKISDRAATYCAKQDQKETTWRIETVYHQIVAYPDKGICIFNQTCEEWKSPPFFFYNKIESLLLSLSEHERMKRLTSDAIFYLRLKQARVKIRYSQYKEAKQILDIISLGVNGDYCANIDYLKMLGRVNFRLSEYLSAQKNYTELLEAINNEKRFDEIKKKYLKSSCLHWLGKTYFHLEEIKKAEIYYDDSLSICREIGDQLGEADCLLSFGKMYLHCSEFDKALDCCSAATTLYKYTGALLGEANSYRTYSEILCSTCSYTQAEQLCKITLELYKNTDFPHGEAGSLKCMGDAHYYNKKYQCAHSHYRDAFKIYRKTGNRKGQAICLQSFCRVNYRMNKLNKAKYFCKKSREIYLEIQDKRGEALCLRSFGDISLKEGDYTLSKNFYDQALILFKNIKYPEGEAKCIQGIAEWLQAQQQVPQSEEYWRKAAEMYRRLAIPLREQHCLEQLRQMKEQKQPADERDKSK